MSGVTFHCYEFFATESFFGLLTNSEKNYTNFLKKM